MFLGHGALIFPDDFRSPSCSLLEREFLKIFLHVKLIYLFFFTHQLLSSINLSLNESNTLYFLTLHPVESLGALNLCDVWASTFTPAANSSLPTCTTFQNLSLFLWGIPVIPSGLERRGTQKLAPCLNPFSMQHILLDLIGWLQYFCSTVWPSTAASL